MCMMMYVYHRDKSPVENRIDSNGHVRILVTSYDRVFVTYRLTITSVIKKKKSLTFYYGESYIYYVLEIRDKAAGLFK